jgi:phosphoribosylglycinamide formyltransferase-1
MNIAVFASGNGTNLQALIDAQKGGHFKSRIVLVVSDKPGAFALERAKKSGIETFVQEPKGFASREEYDRALVKKLLDKKIDFVILAGYMRLVSPYFVSAFRDRIINIHPALLPSFKGTHGIKDAFDHGVKVTGVTVHFVDDALDNGPIILQEALEVPAGCTLESLEEKIHKIEHRLYPEAVKLFEDGKIKIEGRKVIIK